MLGFTRTTRGFTRTDRNPSAEIGSCPSLRLQRKRDRRLQKRTRVSPLRGISANGLLVFAEKRFGQSRDHSQKYDQGAHEGYCILTYCDYVHNEENILLLEKKHLCLLLRLSCRPLRSLQETSPQTLRVENAGCPSGRSDFQPTFFS